MIRQTPELFSQPPVRSDFSRQRIEGGGRRRFIVLLLPVVLVAVLVFGYSLFSEDETAPNEIPTISAENVVKERPEQPGGVDIPHQDMLVFNQIEKGDSANNGQVEHLLPPPDAPQPTAGMPTTVTQPQVNEVGATADRGEGTREGGSASTVTQSNITPVPATPAPTTVATPEPAAPVAQPATTVTSQPVVEKKQEAPKQVVANRLPKELFTSDPSKVAASSGTSAPAGGKTIIQLASVTEQRVAQSEMQKLQSKFASQLGGTKLHVVKAELGAKGVYYRVQSDGMSEANAKSICTALKLQKAGCIIVRP